MANDLSRSVDALRGLAHAVEAESGVHDALAEAQSAADAARPAIEAHEATLEAFGLDESADPWAVYGYLTEMLRVSERATRRVSELEDRLVFAQEVLARGVHSAIGRRGQ